MSPRNNICIGPFCGDSITTGTDNTIFGYESGREIMTGHHNLIVGARSDTEFSHNILIGDDLTGMRDHDVQVGETLMGHDIPSNVREMILADPGGANLFCRILINSTALSMQQHATTEGVPT